MKKLALIFAFMASSLVSISQQNASSIINNINTISEIQSNFTFNFYDLLKHVALENYTQVNQVHKELINNNKDYISQISSLQKYAGDEDIIEEAIVVFKAYREILNDEFFLKKGEQELTTTYEKELLKIKENEALLNKYKSLEKPLTKSFNRIIKKFDVKQVDHSLQDAIDKVNAGMDFIRDVNTPVLLTNALYIEYLDALSRNDIKFMKNRLSLLKKESLKYYDEVKKIASYKDGSNLKSKTLLLLSFFKSNSQDELKRLINYSEILSTPESEINTNEKIKEFNNTVEKFNKLTSVLNADYDKLISATNQLTTELQVKVFSINKP